MTENEKKITAQENQQTIENEQNENQNEEPTFSISEICSKYIIEKLISQTVTIIHSRNLESNFGEFCFDFIKNNINPYLNGIFFSHEEGTDTNETENDNFFFKIPIQKEKNTWIEINEPESAIDDTYLQDRMKFEPYLNKDETNVIKDTLSEFNITNTKKPETNINNNKNTKKKKVAINKKKTENKKEEEIPLFSEDGEYKGPLIEFPSFPLPEEKYINSYVKNDNTVEIKNLRREMEFEKLKKFQNKKIEEEKIKKEKLKQIALRNQKEFDGANYTFDPNGKVISIHKQNKNFSKEFYNVRPRIGFGKVFPNDMKINQKKKRASNDENKIIEKTMNNLEKSIDPFNEDKTKVFAIRRTSDSEIKTSDLGRKIKNEKNKEKEKKDVQIEYNNVNDFIYKKISKINNNNNEPIVISGNNFDFMVPEVGVIIKNERNRGRKEGGFDFSKKYNRPTWEDCAKIINDSVQINSKRYKGGTFSPQKKIPQSATNNNNINNIMNNNNNNNNSMNDINVYNSADLNNIYYNSDQNIPIDYSGNNSSLNSSRNINNVNVNNYYNSNNNYNKSFESNSLIKNAYSVLKQSHNGLNSMSNSLAYSYNTADFNKNNLINSIQLSKNMSNSNLHSLFEDNYNDNNNVIYDDYNNNNNRYLNDDNNNYEKERNLFKNNLKNRKKMFENKNSENIKKNIDSINNFNSQIIRNQNWGTNLYSNPDSYDNKYKKPHKTNHIKEMGYKIVTTKLPRERRLYNGNFEKSRDYIKNILFEES